MLERTNILKPLHMFKCWKNVVLPIAFVLFWLGGINLTACTETAIINFDVINVRSGPSNSYDIIGSLNSNTSVNILESSNGWIKMSSGSLTGFIPESLTSQGQSARQLPPIKVYMNGNLIPFDVIPISVNGCSLVPLRAILENTGATITWDDSSQTITVHKSATTITLTIGSLTPTINGQISNMDIPAQIVNGRTLVPLRFIVDALGCKTTWDGDKRVISILCTVDIVEKISVVTISASDVNIRNGPTTSSDAVGLVPNGTMLAYVGEKDGWCNVIYHGQSAWVAGWLVTGPTTSTSSLSSEEPTLLPVPSTHQDFVLQMKPYAESASKETALPINFLLAQWAEESGFGTSALAKYYNNFGGIKDPNTGGFKRYGSPEEFALDVINLYTQHSNYNRLLADARAGASVQTLLNDLTACHYASAANYGATIRKVYLPEIDSALANIK